MNARVVIPREVARVHADAGVDPATARAMTACYLAMADASASVGADWFIV